MIRRRHIEERSAVLSASAELMMPPRADGMMVMMPMRWDVYAAPPHTNYAPRERRCYAGADLRCERKRREMAMMIVCYASAPPARRDDDDERYELMRAA